jgi:hypothetical protein
MSAKWVGHLTHGAISLLSQRGSGATLMTVVVNTKTGRNCSVAGESTGADGPVAGPVVD